MKAFTVLKPAAASESNVLEPWTGKFGRIEDLTQNELPSGDVPKARIERHINILFVQNLHTSWTNGKPHGLDLHLLTNSREVVRAFYNPERFWEALSRELSRAERFGSPLTLVRCHLDKGTSPKLRKRVSQAFSRACSATLRGYDYAGRLTNNEFVLLFPETDGFGAQAAVQRITRIMEQALSPCESWALRVGIACFPFDAESAETLLTASATNEILYGGYARHAEVSV